MQRNPIVAAYLDQRPFISLLKDLPDPETSVERALHSVFAYQLGTSSIEQVLALCRAAELEGIDPELLIVFANNYAMAADESGCTAEAEPIIRRARALLSDDPPVELEGAVLNAESMLARSQGDIARQVGLLREILDKYSAANSIKRTGATLNLAFYLALLGRAAEVEAELAELEARLPPRARTRTSFFRFIDCLEAGRTAEASALWSRLSLEREALVGYEPEVQAYETLLGLSQSKRPGGDLPWVAVVEALWSRRPEVALDLARRDAASRLEQSAVAVGFPAYTLIRAELSCGNGEAARRLIGRRRERGNVHSLDDLFLARVELLAGDETAAARHLHRSLKALGRNKAEGRLDLELRLACELAPSQLLRMGRTVEKSPQARTTPSGPVDLGRLGMDRLIGKSEHLASVRERIGRFAGLDVPVLITGETGTGKEVVARALHESSPRKRSPFLAVNCGAIPETLLESELFGYERGAFTGAARRHPGLFEQAGKGTLLLDEIGDIPLRLQVLLLRVLEQGEFRPVGGKSLRTIRCRVLAATNRPLNRLVEEGSFREDLLFRLRRLEITLDPLRERPDDVLPLAEHFLAAGRRDGRRPTLTPALQDSLHRYDWSGNVRELANVIERMRIMSSEGLSYDVDAFREACDPVPVAKPSPAAPPIAAAPPPPPASSPAPLPTSLEPGEVERFLKAGRTPMRRRERLRDLFRRHHTLTRHEVASVLGISGNTATRDLQALVAEGFARKVEPSASPRTHYFELSRSA